MSTYPESPRSALLDWCRVHDPIFFSHYHELGLGKAQVVGFRANLRSAAAAAMDQESARQTALVATQDVEQAFAELAAAAGDAVRSIRAFAATSPDADAVYCLAQIPPTAGPSAIGPPGRPSGLSVTLDAATGGLTLRWKTRNPPNARRTTYIIRRKLPGETQFQFVGVAGTKRFVDQSLPAGQESVQYTMQGQRANLSGPVSPVFSVHFGKAAIQSKADSRKSTAGGRGRAIVASVGT